VFYFAGFHLPLFFPAIPALGCSTGSPMQLDEKAAVGVLDVLAGANSLAR
jgi:hypothetical protein